MRKVFFNKWFILSVLLTISLSAFSFIAYKKAQAVCPAANECCKKQVEDNKRGEMIWDAISRQFSSVLIH